MIYKYKHAILGGTFDHLHLGHKQFITTAFNKSKQVTIGIVKTLPSTDKAYADNTEDYLVRKKNLISLLQELNIFTRANIIPINDIYGTSLTDATIEIIFVTESTYANAEKINIKRRELKMPPLTISRVSFALGDDDKIISSSRIRRGEIDRLGRSYSKFFLQKGSLSLPDNLRETLRRPMGTVVSNVKEMSKIVPHSSVVISIGDIVSIDLKKANYPTAISIVDYKTRRQKLDKNIIEKYFPIINNKISNPAGEINPEIAKILRSSLIAFEKSKETQIIEVAGEEDLLALPAILISPLQTYVVYGQHNIGMCVVEVTEETKTLAKHYLEQFN